MLTHSFSYCSEDSEPVAYQHGCMPYIGEVSWAAGMDLKSGDPGTK